jgi:Fur family transcriptional regulator, peroxide stress response regulator
MQDHLQQSFAEHGLRCTRQRRAIYNALSATRKHPTADELYKMVKTGDDNLSLATVYNTLEVLCAAGLAYKLAGCVGNGSTRYDAGGDDHLHLRCRKTGHIADVPDDISKRILEHIPVDLIAELQQRTGFLVSKIQLDLLGEFKNPPGTP